MERLKGHVSANHNASDRTNAKNHIKCKLAQKDLVTKDFPTVLAKQKGIVQQNERKRQRQKGKMWFPSLFTGFGRLSSLVTGFVQATYGQCRKFWASDWCRQKKHVQLNYQKTRLKNDRTSLFDARSTLYTCIHPRLVLLSLWNATRVAFPLIPGKHLKTSRQTHQNHSTAGFERISSALWSSQCNWHTQHGSLTLILKTNTNSLESILAFAIIVFPRSHLDSSAWL